jgi:hypothetical protein
MPNIKITVVVGTYNFTSFNMTISQDSSVKSVFIWTVGQLMAKPPNCGDVGN